MNKDEQEEVMNYIKLKRGEVAIGFAYIEMAIKRLVCQHYLLRQDDLFIAEVLEDEYFNFALLIRIFRKIVKKSDFYKSFPAKDVTKLQELRNILTHSQVAASSKNNSDGKFVLDKIVFVNGGKEYQYESLFKEYFDINERINKAIFDLEHVKFQECELAEDGHFES